MVKQQRYLPDLRDDVSKEEFFKAVKFVSRTVSNNKIFNSMLLDYAKNYQQIVEQYKRDRFNQETELNPVEYITLSLIKGNNSSKLVFSKKNLEGLIQKVHNSYVEGTYKSDNSGKRIKYYMKEKKETPLLIKTMRIALFTSTILIGLYAYGKHNKGQDQNYLEFYKQQIVDFSQR